MEVEIDVEGAIAQEVVEDMFRKGIADALGIPVANVVELTVIEIVQDAGSRRLQSTQKKLYEVSYEVLPPENIDAKVIEDRANRITTSSTYEAEVFQQVLEETSGVAQVSQITSKVPAYQFEEAVTTTPLPPKNTVTQEEGSGTIGIAIGAAGFVTISALVGIVLYRRRTATAGLMWPLKRRYLECDEVVEIDAETGDNAVVVRVPSNTLLQAHYAQAAAKREVKE
jgi:hypothetical protein